MAKVNAVPFDKKEYWEDRFEKEKHFEWLMTWQDIQNLVRPYLDKNEHVLNLGCGNSELPFEIAESGYKKVANVDFAENVIEHMRKVTQDKNNENYAEITWHVGDCLNNLASYLPSGQKYAVLIDKSTIDCIACGDDDQQSIVKTAAREFLSVAKPNAFWFSISFSGEREFYCNNSEDSYWHTIEKIPVQIHQKNDRPGAPPIFYYIYVNRKVTTATSQ